MNNPRAAKQQLTTGIAVFAHDPAVHAGGGDFETLSDDVTEAGGVQVGPRPDHSVSRQAGQFPGNISHQIDCKFKIAAKSRGVGRFHCETKAFLAK